MINKSSKKSIRPSIAIRALVIVAAAGVTLAAGPASAASRGRCHLHASASGGATLQEPRLQNDTRAVEQLFRTNGIDAWRNAVNG